MPAFQNYTPMPTVGPQDPNQGVGLQSMPKKAVGLRSIPQGGGLGMGGSNNMRGMSNMGMANSTAPQRLYGNQTGFAQAAASGPRVAHYQPQPGFGYQGPNAVQANQGGPSAAQIQAEMQRRGVGAQLGPRNAALSGYMMAPNNPQGR